MPEAAMIQASFNAGEFGPLVHGRVDYPKYQNGVSLMQNFVPLVQGPATRRTGTEYVAPTKSSVTGRLVPFVFSTGDAFMLEFTNGKLRFFQNRAPVVLTGQSITAITNANPCVVTYSGADTYANGEEVIINGVVGMEELNGRRFLVSNVSGAANTFELQDINGNNVNSTSYGTYSSAGTIEEIYEITSPYGTNDIANLRVLQSRDVMYIAHPDYEPRSLSRASATSWSFATVNFLDGPYLPINSTSTTFTPAAVSGSGINVTASAVTGINDDTGFQTTDVGRKMRIKHGSVWGWATIVSRISTTQVTVDIDPDAPFGNTTAKTTWRLGSWSDTTGYPSVVFYFEDRIGWGATVTTPTTLDLSKSGDYENMAPTGIDATVAADNALQLKANQKREDPIRWVNDDEKGLVCGTKGAEFVAPSSTTGEAMSAVNYPALRRATKWGSAFIEPVVIGKSTLFVQASKRKVRDMGFVFESDGFRAPNRSVIAHHATKSGIEELAYQQEPYSVVWARMANYSLWGMTYDDEQDVLAWHRHILGGYSDASNTLPPNVVSIATMPSPDGTQDDLWMITKRYINGYANHYVEIMSEYNEDYTDVTECFFVDFGKTVTLGSPGTTATGFDHLEGEEVSALVDGKPVPDVTVTGGNVTVTTSGTIFTVGYNYTSRIKTLRPEAGSANGTAQGKKKRIHKLTGRFHQTVGCWVGRDFDGSPMEPIDFREGAHAMGAAVPLYTGDKELPYESDHDTDGYVCIETRQPLPCTLVALMSHVNTQDRT